MEEKRRFPRAPFDGEAHLQANGSTMPVELMDISLRGALLSLPEGIALSRGDDGELTLLMEDSELRIPLPVTVRRTQGQLAGVEFGKVEVEAMQHLRRLLELHLGEGENLDALWLDGES